MALEADSGVEARIQIIVSDDRSEIVPGDKVLSSSKTTAALPGR